MSIARSLNKGSSPQILFTLISTLEFRLTVHQKDYMLVLNLILNKFNKMKLNNLGMEMLYLFSF